MPDSNVTALPDSKQETAFYDAIVIGAGISGMFMLYRLRELGMRTLREDGIRSILNGETTVEEVLKYT